MAKVWWQDNYILPNLWVFSKLNSYNIYVQNKKFELYIKFSLSQNEFIEIKTAQTDSLPINKHILEVLHPTESTQKINILKKEI